MGLKVGEVKLEKYNPDWKKMFLEEKNILKEMFEDVALEIEHIGSTSIEGLSAKPIIDILVKVNKLKDFEKIKENFDEEPYSIKQDSPDDEILIRKGKEENRTHFIHVMEKESQRCKDTIIFRDYLRKNKKVLEKYENLKKELAKKYYNNRKMYTSSKTEFINEILIDAKKALLAD